MEGLDWPILHGGQREGSPHPFPADLPSFLFQDLVMHPGSADCVPGPGHGTGDGVNQIRLGRSGETGIHIFHKHSPSSALSPGKEDQEEEKALDSRGLTV